MIKYANCGAKPVTQSAPENKYYLRTITESFRNNIILVLAMDFWQLISFTNKVKSFVG